MPAWVGRLALITVGAAGFLALASTFSRPPRTVQLSNGGSPQPVVEPTSTARAANKEGGTADANGGLPTPAMTAARHKGILTDPERADILLRAQQLIASNTHEMDPTSTDLEKYLLHWRTIAKLQAVAQKLDSGDYTLLPQVDLFSMDGETKDQSVVAFSIARGVVRILFTRQADAGVFAVIDTCAANQQAAWDAAVRDFNEQPEADRQRLIDAHKRSETALAKLYAEVDAMHQASPLEFARARHDEIRRLQADLLPFYMVVPKNQTLAWARQSIGR